MQPRIELLYNSAEIYILGQLNIDHHILMEFGVHGVKKPQQRNKIHIYPM